MYKKILVAVGGPDASMEPARVAARMARHDGASLTFVSVHRAVPAAVGEPYYSEMIVPRVGEAEQTLRQAEQTARREGIDNSTIETIEGDPAQKIVEIAQRGDFDLVVMGTHRRGRLGAALLGSVSNTVAARAARPVLIVPERPPTG